MAHEQTTAANLVAMGLFFIGDVLDTILFPRERDGERVGKLVKRSMLVFGLFAVFLLLMRFWFWGAALSLAWIIFIPIYDGARAATHNETTATNIGEETGFKALVPHYEAMAKAKYRVREKLCMQLGVYSVSMALARKSERYTCSIWVPNEAAKFIRSAVFPVFAGIIGLSRSETRVLCHCLW